jgi:hypothetical protein
MRTSLKSTPLLPFALSLAVAPAAFAATVTPITSFDPNTFFADGITAGIDFDDDSNTTLAGNQLVTQPGFLSIPPSNNKTYNVTTNGITFGINVINANQGNQNRWRNSPVAGALLNDFEQWYGSDTIAGNPVAATFTLSGLLANTDYRLSFFTYNVGAGQTTHRFYEGTSSAAPLITTFTTSGGPASFATWVPGITFQINSGVDSEIAVTVVAPEFPNGANSDSRLTFAGLAVTAIPEPSSAALLALGGLAVVRRRRRRRR